MGGRQIIMVHSHLVPSIIQQSLLYSYKQGYLAFKHPLLSPEKKNHALTAQKTK